MASKVKLLRLRQVAEMLDVNVMTLRRWDKDGILPAIRVGKRGDRRYQEKDVLKLVSKKNAK